MYKILETSQAIHEYISKSNTRKISLLSGYTFTSCFVGFNGMFYLKGTQPLYGNNFLFVIMQAYAFFEDAYFSWQQWKYDSLCHNVLFNWHAKTFHIFFKFIFMVGPLSNPKMNGSIAFRECLAYYQLAHNTLNEYAWRMISVNV